MAAAGGRRRAEPVKKTPGPFVVLGSLLAGAIFAAVAWFFLVNAAIDFGSEARGGKASGWAFMALATVGAITCLVLVLVLATRTLSLLGITPPQRLSARSASKPGGGGSHAGGHSSQTKSRGSRPANHAGSHVALPDSASSVSNGNSTSGPASTGPAAFDAQTGAPVGSHAGPPLHRRATPDE